MNQPEYRNATIRLLSLQCELSMRIGSSLELGEMLRSVLVALVQRLRAPAAQVWLRDVEGAIVRNAYPACSLGEWQQDPALNGLLEHCMTEGASEDVRVFECGDRSVVHGLPIGQSGWMFIQQGSAVIDGVTLSALSALMHRLDVACRACDEFARSKALLALTREQNRALAEANERAESASTVKSEFLAAISHEMRTPLNGILGFAELLQLELTDTEHAEYARSIFSSGRHLHAMFNDLLDLSRLDAKRMALHPEDIDLEMFCSDLWSSHSVAVKNKGLQGRFWIEPDVPRRIVVDPVRLRQVLNNLLGNALKYTTHGRVELDVKMADGMLAFAVSDTGAGIPPEAHELVFERFRQAGNVITRSHEGAGLGLAIAREFAEQMGGFIVLRSVPGEGSVFTLHLPGIDPGLGVDSSTDGVWI